MRIVIFFEFSGRFGTMKAISALFCVALLFLGCSQQSDQAASGMMQEIKGRDNSGARFAVYRVRIPEEWLRRDPLPDESIIDSTKALCEFLIRDEGKTIRIAIHNFPTADIEERIPLLPKWLAGNVSSKTFLSLNLALSRKLLVAIKESFLLALGFRKMKR